MPTAGPTTQGRAKTFTVREILERPMEIMTEIEELATSLGEDEVLVCEATSCPRPFGRRLSSLGLELVVDQVVDGVRSAVFHGRRSDAGH